MTRWAFWSVVTLSTWGMHPPLSDVSSTFLRSGGWWLCPRVRPKNHHSRHVAVLLTPRPPEAPITAAGGLVNQQGKGV